MYGEGLVVKEVGGAAYEFQTVDEVIACGLVGKVDGEHRAARRTKLPHGQVVIRIVGQTDVIDLHDGVDRP